MARIRSNHPGQWSDEDFVGMSYPSRLLALGLRNLADDRGIFEWKPLTLKMQLFPADNEDMVPLMEELVANNQVLKFEVGGKSYGAIRNFMKWQRPKKPTYVHPAPEAVLKYVAASGAEGGNPTPTDGDGCEPDTASGGNGSVPVRNQSPTGTEKSPQRKEVGGRKKEEKDSCPKPAAGRISYPPAFEDVWKAYPTDKLMSKKDGFNAWKKLADDDKALLARSLPAFNAYCQSDPSYRPVHFVRYVISRRFDGMADDSQPIHIRQAGTINGKPLRDANGNLTNAALFGRG
jgi:hypothetical protein